MTCGAEVEILTELGAELQQPKSAFRAEVTLAEHRLPQFVSIDGYQKYRYSVELKLRIFWNKSLF